MMVSCSTTHGLKSQAAVDGQLSKAVYATRDNMDAGRFDLAYQYSGEAVRLIGPPKERIPTKPIYAEY